MKPISHFTLALLLLAAASPLSANGVTSDAALFFHCHAYGDCHSHGPVGS